jgi:hypothetical protein
MQDVC